MEARHGPDPNVSQCEETTQDDLRGRVTETRRDGSAGAASSAGRGWGNLAGADFRVLHAWCGFATRVAKDWSISRLFSSHRVFSAS